MKVRLIKRRLYKRFYKLYKLDKEVKKDVIASFKKGLLSTTIADSNLDRKI